MSYSGQCLMSSIIGGRSGNRGECAQPCRLPYELVSHERTVKNGYLLSPKDLCLADEINKLSDIGVASLKIEGRLKRPEYVGTVVGAFRRCIDRQKADEQDFSEEKLREAGITRRYVNEDADRCAEEVWKELCRRLDLNR